MLMSEKEPVEAHRGKTTAYMNGGRLCAFASRYSLHDSPIEDGDTLEWHWDAEREQLVAEVIDDD